MTTALTDEEFLRYGRQVLLPEIGEAGQLRLKQSKVLIVGLGGLGSPALLYLAGAGVGHLWLSDGDKVDTTNLQRQILYRTSDRHSLKTKAAIQQVKALNPAVQCHPLPAVDAELLANIVPQVDLVLDCSDNMATRQAVNSACVRFQKPLVTAAAVGWQGQMMLIEPAQAGACYHCVFPSQDEASLSCREAGIVGPVVGILGTAQALLAMQLICDLPRPTGILQRFDGRTLTWQRLSTLKDPTCPICSQSTIADAGADLCLSV